jgi:hypothetical protein
LKTKWLAAILLLTACAAAQSSGPHKYWQHTIGETDAQFAAIEQVAVPKPECAGYGSHHSCRQNSASSDDQGVETTFIFNEQKLERIFIRYNLERGAVDFDDAYLKALGEPTATGTIVNGFNVPQAITATWLLPDGRRIGRMQRPEHTARIKQVEWELK